MLEAEAALDLGFVHHHLERGFELVDQVPRKVIGRTLTLDEAAALLARLRDRRISAP